MERVRAWAEINRERDLPHFPVLQAAEARGPEGGHPHCPVNQAVETVDQEWVVTVQGWVGRTLALVLAVAIVLAAAVVQGWAGRTLATDRESAIDQDRVDQNPAIVLAAATDQESAIGQDWAGRTLAIVLAVVTVRELATVLETVLESELAIALGSATGTISSSTAPAGTTTSLLATVLGVQVADIGAVDPVVATDPATGHGPVPAGDITAVGAITGTVAM